MGDRICVMKDGEIMQVDDPLNLYNKPRNMFVAGFIGSPPMNFFHGRIEQGDGGLYFIERGEPGTEPFRLPLKKHLIEAARSRIGKDIVLGCRPENLEALDIPAPDTLPAIIDVFEPMGAETFLYLNTLAGHSFIAKVHAEHTYRMGEKTHIRVDTTRALIFDPESELTLD